MRRSSQSAVALVMTLIMLSVITVVAVAFLALSQRERIQVSQSTQQSDAEIMAEAGMERAKAEIFARYLGGGTNLNAVDLLVSRNYIRQEGFIRGNNNTTNVNYDHTQAGAPLDGTAWQLNIANLYYDPRPPVFVNTNFVGGPEILDFRFYLDLNRNRRFETNGLIPALDNNGRPLVDGRGVVISNEVVGDPEWIGVLEHPEFAHSRTNRFMGRYAYIVLPIGKSLDVNFIHNQGKRLLPVTEPSYYRNQGFGSWELNLAGFLADLNTNVWDPRADNYFYETSLIAPSKGVAFRDALEIYHTRLTSYQNLAPANQLLNPNAVLDFEGDMIDAYADGSTDAAGKDNDIPTRPWPGSYNWTNFFTVNDFYDIFRTSNFRNHLLNTGLANSTYDRYTFYRMLAQLSTDSASENPRVDAQQLRRKVGSTKVGDFVAEPAGKININYDNLNYPISEMAPWNPDDFFNTVANVLLSSVGLSVTNIQIYPTNYYGLTVHRMLQMAANLYDATTSNRFPSVFRPIVITEGTGKNITNYISRYYYDDRANTVTNWLPTSYGMPMIIGAKKCIPNFNEYDSGTAVSVARKLELRRVATNAAPNMTNEMYIIGISNFFGLEAWNSCTQAFQGPLQMLVADNVTLTLTNSEGLKVVTNHVFSILNPLSSWQSFGDPKNPDRPVSTRSFEVPLFTNIITLNNGVYRTSPTARFDDVSTATNVFTPNSGFHTPQWYFSISNNLTYVLSITNRILDFVHLANLTNDVNLSRDVMGYNRQVLAEPAIVAKCWGTNRVGASPTLFTPTDGILEQIDISLANPNADLTEWTDYGGTGDKKASTDSFREFVSGTGNNTNTIQQAPFTPTRKIVINGVWSVNDPLVHHIEEHLKDTTNNYSFRHVRPFINPMPTNQTLRRINERYSPWGRSPLKLAGNTDKDPRLKDPGITKADDWDFPTNKFPSIGWLGRVHRGTPWQTIYLKSGVAPLADWARYSLDPLSHPTNDWRLVDVFTTAIHPNASHGQLSINQTNFAAWSALLSGVVATTNTLVADKNNRSIDLPIVIEPGSPQLLAIYEAIQTNRNQFPDKTFRRLGDLLAVPQLTDLSPFLNMDPNGSADIPYADGITDTILERIPQQILSLVKVGDPRYVIYAYGQALRPAPDSILTSGPFVGMCTNYQVTGEFVTRSVFQIEGTAGAPRPVVKAFNILSSE